MAVNKLRLRLRLRLSLTKSFRNWSKKCERKTTKLPQKFSTSMNIQKLSMSKEISIGKLASVACLLSTKNSSTRFSFLVDINLAVLLDFIFCLLQIYFTVQVPSLTLEIILKEWLTRNVWRSSLSRWSIWPRRKKKRLGMKSLRNSKTLKISKTCRTSCFCPQFTKS